MTSEIPQKPRRKKVLEVPVHHKIPGDYDSKSGEIARKTYSANYNSKRYNKHHKSISDSPKYSKHHHHEIPIIAIDTDNNSDSLNRKLSRKHLSSENQKLIRENEEIVGKFNELEDLSLKKITKLRDKVTTLQNANREISSENEFLRGQIQDLFHTIDEINAQLELSKNCASCKDLKENIEKCTSENNILRSTKNELEEDLNMLKTVVFRLNLQMERYQEKMRQHNIKISQIPSNTPNAHNESHTASAMDLNNLNILSNFHSDHTHTPISWGKVNVHTLGPLLDAYQDTISEKDEIIESYERELSNFTGKLKEVIRENENLHQSLTEDDECSSKLKIQLENTNKDLKITKEQNDILIKKCSLKQDKLEEVLKCYESKVEQLKRDYAVVHEQYYKSRTEVAALREKNKALVDSQDDFKNERHNYIPVSVHTTSVNECKKWYEELKLQYEQEKTKQLKLIDELQGQVAYLSKEKDELGQKVAQLEKHIKKGETKYLDLEHALHEVQVSRSACRKQLHKAMSFAKDLVSEQETLLKALNQRQQENKAVKKIGSDIAVRMDSLKSQLKDVQRDAFQELTTVERRMQEQCDAIQTMRQEHNEEIERLQQIIREHEENKLREQSATSMPHYLLFRDKHK